MASDSVDRDQSDTSSTHFRSTSLSARVALVVERFLRDWRSGNRSPIEDYLHDISAAERRLMLLALLRQEMSLLMQMGKLPLIDPYLTRFPDDQETVTKAFTLAQRDVDSEATVIVPSSSSVMVICFIRVAQKERPHEVAEGGVFVRKLPNCRRTSAAK